MKILIKITKDILKQSMMCGVNIPKDALPISKLQQIAVGANCAFALAVREIWPNASIGDRIYPYYFPEGNIERQIAISDEAWGYIKKFDLLRQTPEMRLELPEQSFEIDVPHSILEKVGISEVYKILSESKTLECVSI